MKAEIVLTDNNINIDLNEPTIDVSTEDGFSVTVIGGVGPQGNRGPEGPKGEKGDDYVLTEEDKDDIAGIAAEKVDLTEYVRNTDFATGSVGGVVKVNQGLGVNISLGSLCLTEVGSPAVKGGVNAYKALTPKYQHESVFYGLAKAAGVDMSSSDESVGTYTEAAKAAIRAMLDVPSSSDIPAVPVQDVQVDGASILVNGVANVPCANAGALGVVQIEAEYGITVMPGTRGKLRVQQASAAQIKGGQQAYKPIVPANQHLAVFYGLAAAAGADMASSSNPIGSYTSEAKAAIRAMLGLDDQSIVGIVEAGFPAAEGVEW